MPFAFSNPFQRIVNVSWGAGQFLLFAMAFRSYRNVQVVLTLTLPDDTEISSETAGPISEVVSGNAEDDAIEEPDLGEPVPAGTLGSGGINIIHDVGTIAQTVNNIFAAFSWSDYEGAEGGLDGPANSIYHIAHVGNFEGTPYKSVLTWLKWVLDSTTPHTVNGDVGNGVVVTHGGAGRTFVYRMWTFPDAEDDDQTAISFSVFKVDVAQLIELTGAQQFTIEIAVSGGEPVGTHSGSQSELRVSWHELAAEEGVSDFFASAADDLENERQISNVMDRLSYLEGLIGYFEQSGFASGSDIEFGGAPGEVENIGKDGEPQYQGIGGPE